MFVQKPRSTGGVSRCARIEGLEPRTLLSGSTVTSISATVDGRSGPWMPGPTYGIGDELAPTVITASSGLPFQTTDALTIQYVSGQVSAGLPNWPLVDAGGDTAYGPVNNNMAPSNTHYPSFWMNASEYPTYLTELVGVFTDSAGNFVGSPFAIGDSRTTHIPAGATQLQLGVNDHIFHDNAGAWQLTIREDNGPDLTGTFSTPPPDSIVHGKSGSTTFAITNIGPEEARGGVTTSVFLETQPSLGHGDIPLASPVNQSVDLTTGASTNINFDFTIPPTTAPGTYYLVGQIVEDSGIIDLNASDKAISIPIQINPVLSASMSSGLPVVVGPGGQFTVPLTLTNAASEDLSGSATISYWLSKGSTVNSSTDLLLSTTTHTFTISANGGTATPGDQVTIPTKLFPNTDRWGEYHVIAVVTPDAALSGGDAAPAPAVGLTQIFSKQTAPAAALWETAVQGPASSFTGSAADLITLDQGGKTSIYFDAAGHPMIGVNINLNQFSNRTIDAAAGAGTGAELRARIQTIQRTWKSAYGHERLSGKAKDYAAFVSQNPGLFTPMITTDQAAALFSASAARYTRLAAATLGGARKFATLPANVQVVAADIAFSRPATLRAMAADLLKGDYATAAWDMMNARINTHQTWADANSAQVLGDGDTAPGDFHVLLQSFEDEVVSFVQPR